MMNPITPKFKEKVISNAPNKMPEPKPQNA